MSNFLRLISFLYFVSSAFADPHLVLEEKEYNFGEVAEGTLVEHNFKLSNTGNSTLEIRKINPACGCTAVVIDSDKIAPGSSTFIKAKFDTSGFTGVKDKGISVYTNDPENVNVSLSIKGKIVSDVIISPARIYLGDIEKGTSTNAEVKLTSVEGKNIKFGQVRSRSDLLSVTSSNIENGGKILKISLSKDAPLGDFHGRITVESTSKLNPIINIPVLGYVHGDLLITPKSLSLGVFEGPLKEVVKGKIFIENTGSKAINIKSLDSSSDAVSADFSVVKPGVKYSINVSLPVGSIGVIQSVLTIKTDHPDSKQQEVTVPVYAIINPAQDS